MPHSPSHHPLLAFALLLLFALSGCALGPGSPTDRAALTMAYYLDANLGVALEHPEHWPRQKRIVDSDPDAQLTVNWQPRRRWGVAPELGMSLTSLPPKRAVGGFATLMQRYLERNPEVVSGQQVDTVVAGLPGLRLEASTPQRQLLVYFVTSAQRAVTLEFSANPALFEANLALFEEIAASLTILTPAPAAKPGSSRSN